MLQAAVTLLFLSITALAAGGIALMLARNWPAIRSALGLVPVAVPQPLPPRYRALPARRATTERGGGQARHGRY